MTRLIDADILKEAINTWDKFACLPNGKLEPFRNLEHPEMFEPYIHFRDVIKAIDNAPPIPLPDFKEGYKQAILDGKTNFPRQEGEWTPVSEKLPEINKAVIVTDIEVSTTYISRYIGNGYWECDNGPFKDRIIAWQEKPETYKEPNNETIYGYDAKK